MEPLMNRAFATLSLLLVLHPNGGNCVPSYVTCAPSDSQRQMDFFPNVCNCTEFYRCNHKSPVAMSCPSGLHWNSKANSCDWPQNAGCSAQTCQNADPSAHVYVPNPNDCRFYYQCHGGRVYCMECAPGLHFNPKVSVCDYPANVNCSSVSVLTGQTTVP